MRRHLHSSAGVCTAAIVSLGLAAAPALAAGSATTPTTSASTATTPTTSASTVTTPATSATTATTSATTPTTPTPPAPTTPTTPPVKAAAKLSLPNAFVVDHEAVSVPGRMVQVTGVVRPYAAGQWVEVQALLGRRRVKSDRLRIKPSADGASGQFTEKLASPRAGILDIKVTHASTPQMLGFAVQRRIGVLDENARFGSRGKFVTLIQQRLSALHVYLPLTGVYDQQTGLALDAYHRLLHRGTSQSLDKATIDALLNGVGTFQVRDPGDGTHVEGNLSDQLLALIYGSKVYRIYPISSGKPSTPTVTGHFHVYIRDPGYLPDGMYYSDFFYSGYAIHGYDPAPDYPASHGCMRLPIVDAISVFDWLNYGDVVDVYG